MPAHYALPALFLAAALPFLISWLVAVVPTRRRQVSGVVLGNPLSAAPRPIAQVITLKPLLHLSRALTGEDVRGYIVGARHLPVEHTAPIMTRYVKGDDPALQLYAQSVLLDGVERLQHWQQTLAKADAKDERCAAWLIEVGLTLAHRNLASAADRASLLKQLHQHTERCLKQTVKASPHLLANAAQLYLEAGYPQQAQALLQQLPSTSPLRASLQLEVAHALNRELGGAA
jgi:hypothetical protein